MPRKKKESGSVSKESLAKAKSCIKTLYSFLSVDSLSETQILETLINYCQDKIEQDKLGQQGYILAKAQEIINMNPQLIPQQDPVNHGLSEDVIIA